MPFTIPVDSAIIQIWINTKQYTATIKAELQAKGMDTVSISSYTSEYQLLRNLKRQFTSFFCMRLGVLLGFISCVLSIFNPVFELYNLFLFGITYVAILIIFYGLYGLIE